MKAPDKIYLQRVPSNQEVIDGWTVEPVKHTVLEDIEYIRKDALLEWLKIAEECYSHPDTVNVVDTIRCEGKKWAIQDVINKIESL